MDDVISRLRRAIEVADGEEVPPNDTTYLIENAARAFLAALPPEHGARLERRLAAITQAITESPPHTPVAALAMRAREIVRRAH